MRVELKNAKSISHPSIQSTDSIMTGRSALYLLICLSIKVESLLEPLVRRTVLQQFLTTAPGFLLSSSSQSPAPARRGAAELDFEYYVRDLLGNNRNGLSTERPLAPPPRTLAEPLVSILYDIPLQLLTTKAQSKTSTSKEQSNAMTNDRINDYRTKAARSFHARAAWKQESLSDQYYFDLTLYALWRTAADLIPEFTNRDKYLRQVGELVYQKILLLQKQPGSKEVSIERRLVQVLDAFQHYGFIRNYRIEGSPLDLDSLSDVLISIFESATLGACLQLTGEQSRFVPDLCGATLAAVFREQQFSCAWETYFVDNVYRPNPNDYYPNEQLYQFTITPAAT
jgi:hypothetical protein